MNKLLLLSFVVLLLSSCEKKEGKSIAITNPSDINLTDKAVSINLKAVSPGFPILVTDTRDTIPSQLDDLDGDGIANELFLVIDLEANSVRNLNLTFSQTDPGYVIRTSLRAGKRDLEDTPVKPITQSTLLPGDIPGKLGYISYQTDGPSFENDLAGFRHYFDGRNSKDIFGKKVKTMAPEDVGIGANGIVEDNYHVMADWGRDILGTANAVGIGGINLMLGDQLSRIGNIAGDSVTNIESSTFNFYREGPVRSVMDIQHNNWKPLDRTYQVNERIIIWPGMYAFQNNASFTGLQGDETLLVGIVNSASNNPLKEVLVNEKYVALISHDKQTYDNTWWLGLAVILPRDVYLGWGEAPKEGIFSDSFYGKLKIEENKPVTYYSVGGWELSDEGFIDPDYFEAYVTDLANQLSVDVAIQVRE
ncbi:MAG: DUF4861 domain-containing protein [Bacteroidetes bacterium]|nr:DUF4861 domain-containing protein [Bacteroidota bacterium]MDA1122176.1 DUF4861 domain-containing protein [Bacteroidota bacterium]